MTAAALQMPAVALWLSTPLMALSGAAALADEQPVASATNAEGKVRVDVLSLKRTEGDTVTLRIVVVNNGNDNYPIVMSSVKLVDIVNRRTYGAGLSTSVCNPAPDQRLTCWAMYAAPPANTKTMSVQIPEHFDLITGIPVSQ
jgi:hypothetical protein